MTKRRLGTLSWVGVMRTLTKIHLAQLDRCNEEVQEALAERLQEFASHVDARAQRMEGEVREEWYDWNSDRHWELSELFPQTITHSMFITSYAFLEHSLSQLSRGLAHEAPKRVTLEQLKGEGIDLAQAYIKNVQAIDFPDQSIEWNRISDYRKTRNFLVHAQGRVDSSKRGEAVRRFLKNNPELGSLDHLGRIVLKPAACKDLIRTTRSFLKRLFDNIEAKQRRHRRAQRKSSAV